MSHSPSSPTRNPNSNPEPDAKPDPKPDPKWGAAGLRLLPFAVLMPLLLSTASQAQNQAALERLEESPRHHEWVTVETETRPIDAFVVYPESAEKSTVVLVIHENRGLTDWVRGVADRLAEEGYIAVAPDMLSGRAPEGGRTRDFESSNAARDALYEVDRDQIQAELAEVTRWAHGLDAANGKLAVAGFCWGGRNTFSLATHTDLPEAFFVFYGSGPEAEAIGRISAPVYGFYGERDERVNATIPATREAMADRSKSYEPVIYDDAGHGFMRAAEAADADAASREAAEAAWGRWLGLLAEL